MKISKVITIGTVVACLLTTSAFSVSANSTKTQTKAVKNNITLSTFDQKGANQQRLNNPKQQGTDRSSKQKKGNPMDSLVAAGTITQDQADAIKTAMEAAIKSKQTMEETINGLVTAGTLTQDQADAILKDMPQRNFKFGPMNAKNPMAELISAGTITQDQADAIRTAMKTAIKSKQTIKDAISGLVMAGTLTQDQADAILNLLPASK